MDKILLLNCLISLSLCVCVWLYVACVYLGCVRVSCFFVHFSIFLSTILRISFSLFVLSAYLSSYLWLTIPFQYNCIVASHFSFSFSLNVYTLFTIYLISMYISLLSWFSAGCKLSWLCFPLYLFHSFLCVFLSLFITGSLCFFLSLCALSWNTFQTYLARTSLRLFFVKCRTLMDKKRRKRI